MAACGGGASTPAQIGPGAAKGPETPPKTAEAPDKGADAPAKAGETPAKAGAPSGSAPSGGAPGAASGSALAPAKTGTAPSTLSDEDQWGGKQLIEAAKKEGKVVLYTAQFQKQEQLVINAFQKQFPEIKVEMNRLGGGPLYEKIKTKLEANALRADVITLSDVGLMLRLKDAMADHSPPTEQWYSDSAKQKGFY
ncbi:MAG: extracellular solute-binding protein [Chloroflexi bacterium]|nr:extracellular solute-binding protein [Chloroflexota bacterium]